MTKKLFILALGLILAMPFFLFAEEQEVEIQLVEVVGAGNFPGDEPFDSSGTIGGNPSATTGNQQPQTTN